MAPFIVYTDEIDAIATTRYDTISSGERMMQRAMLESFSQPDGFESPEDVKVLLATNWIETLNPKLLRPARIGPKD